MLNDQQFPNRTTGGIGFLRLDKAAAKEIGNAPSFPTNHKSTLSSPFDDLRWPYAISPLQAYLYGVITVWAVFILYHFCMVTIHAARKRRIRRRGTEKQSKRRNDDHRHRHQHHSLHIALSSRPCARMAEIPPVSPVYQPSKMSIAKLRRKIGKKINARLASRQRRKIRKEVRTKARTKKATKLPTSPSYELFQHMNSQPLGRFDGGGEGLVTESHHSFVPSVRKIVDQEISNDILPEANNISKDTCTEPIKEGVNKIENTAPSYQETSITETRFLTVLHSSEVYEYTQKAKQKETLDLLNDLQILHVTIDGMDPFQRDMRNHLFGVSGVRGNYPQIFCSSDGDHDHTYLGGYDWIQSMPFDDLRKIVA